jgi:hypothetical protein
VSGCCENGNEPSGSIKGGGSAPWSYLARNTNYIKVRRNVEVVSVRNYKADLDEFRVVWGGGASRPKVKSETHLSELFFRNEK